MIIAIDLKRLKILLDGLVRIRMLLRLRIRFRCHVKALRRRAVWPSAVSLDASLSTLSQERNHLAASSRSRPFTRGDAWHLFNARDAIHMCEINVSEEKHKNGENAATFLSFIIMEMSLIRRSLDLESAKCDIKKIMRYTLHFKVKVILLYSKLRIKVKS